MAYDDVHAMGAIALVVAGCLSGVAVFFALLALACRFTSISPYVMPYVVCLLFANLLQAIGAIMNAKWVADRAVEAGGACTMQAVFKQAGNVGTAVWAFALSVYVFVILFLRYRASPVVRYTTLGGGWIFIVVIVLVGPTVIQTDAQGPYFGPSGYWCWITPKYPKEQLFLEYFFEFLSVGICFFLHIASLLRVRGNLVHTTDGWRLQIVPRSERWRIAVNRDWVDSSMLQAATILIWFPIAYSVLLFPVAIVRLFDFGGNIPFWATIFADTLFNLQGLANFVLLMCARRFMTDSAVLPSFAAPRRAVTMSSSGITPFVLPPPSQGQPAETALPGHANSTQARPESIASMTSTESFGSVDSLTPLKGTGRVYSYRPA